MCILVIQVSSYHLNGILLLSQPTLPDCAVFPILWVSIVITSCKFVLVVQFVKLVQTDYHCYIKFWNLLVGTCVGAFTSFLLMSMILNLLSLMLVSTNSVKNETDLRLYSYNSTTNSDFIAFLPYYVISPSLKYHETSLRLTPEYSWITQDSHISNIISSTYLFHSWANFIFSSRRKTSVYQHFLLSSWTKI